MSTPNTPIDQIVESLTALLAATVANHLPGCPELDDAQHEANKALIAFNNWRAFIASSARPGDVANVIIERDLMARQVRGLRGLIPATEEAEQYLRNYAGEDPGECLTGGSPRAEAVELADRLQETIRRAKGES